MFDNPNIKAVCVGEVLYDVFKDEKKVGGAPLNLAIRLRSLGIPASMLSIVGNDENGKNLVEFVKKHNVDASGISVSEQYETGIVQVTLNERGSATYEIKFPSAWDFWEVTDTNKKLVENADVFFYGSLICRNSVSKETLLKLLKSNNKMLKVFDVNLRKPHYSLSTIQELMAEADFVKLNDEEILELAPQLGSKGETIEDHMKFLSGENLSKSVCVTKGKHGAVLLWEKEFYSNGGYTVTVADTVGAGDSFLAALLAKLLTKAHPQEAIDFASAVGALVASKSGPNPDISLEDIKKIMTV